MSALTDAIRTVVRELRARGLGDDEAHALHMNLLDIGHALCDGREAVLAASERVAADRDRRLA